MHSSSSFGSSSKLIEERQRHVAASASGTNQASNHHNHASNNIKRARAPAGGGGVNTLHHAVSISETTTKCVSTASTALQPVIAHRHGMGDSMVVTTIVPVSNYTAAKTSSATAYRRSATTSDVVIISDEDEINDFRHIHSSSGVTAAKKPPPPSTIGGGSLASSGYQTDQQPLKQKMVISSGQRRRSSSTTTAVDTAPVSAQNNHDTISVDSTHSSLQLPRTPADYQYYNHRIDWRRYEPGVNMSMVLHDAKHAKRQQNFFTKHWGEQFVPLPLDRFTSSTALSKSKHLIRLYTTACNINKEHFRTYLDELRRRDRRVKRQHQQQQQHRQRFISSSSVYGVGDDNEVEKRTESPSKVLWLSKSATSASLQSSASVKRRKQQPTRNRLGSLTSQTGGDVTDDEDTTSEVIFMRGATSNDEPLRRRRLSTELEGIPKVFFDPSFTLQLPSTFTQVIPWSLFSTSFANKSSSSSAVTDQNDNTTLSVRIHHDKLSHYMDLIEIQMAQHVAERAEGFFSAVMRHDVLRAGIGATGMQINAARTALAEAEHAVAQVPETLHRAHVRRERCQEVLRIACAINAVHAAQPTLQHLLAQADYLAALEVLQTTREVLANDALLTRVDCFRHLQGQLLNMAIAVERMCRDEFVKCLGSFWNQPVRLDELVEMIFGDSNGELLSSLSDGEQIMQKKRRPQNHGDSIMGVYVDVISNYAGESNNSRVFLALLSERELTPLDACTFTSAFMALLKMKHTDFIYSFRNEAIAALQASLKLIICETLAACDHRTSSPLLGNRIVTSTNNNNNSLALMPKNASSSSRPASAASTNNTTTKNCAVLAIDVHQMYATVNAMPFIDWIRLLERMCAASLCVLQRIHYTALLMQQCIEQHFVAASQPNSTLISDDDELHVKDGDSSESSTLHNVELLSDSNHVLRTRLLLALNDECIAVFGSRVQDALVDIVHERLVMLFPLFNSNVNNNNDADNASSPVWPTKSAHIEFFDQIWRILSTFCSYIERQKISTMASSYRTSILRGFMHDFGSSFLAHYFHAEIKLEKLELLLQNESWEPAHAVPAEYQRFFTALERERHKVLVDAADAAHMTTNVLAPIDVLLPDSSETLRLNGNNINVLTRTDERALHELLVVKSIHFSGIDDDINSNLVLPSVAVLLVQMLVKYCHKASQYRALADEVLRLLVDLMKHFNSRLCQLILGAGAVLQPAARSQATESGRSPTPTAPAAGASRKSNISSRDLALSWQCLQLLILMIPFIRAHFQYLLSSSADETAAGAVVAQRSSKQKRALINKLNTLGGDLRDHQQRNMAKIVGVMRSLITRSLTTWQLRAPTPSAAFQHICSKLQSLHANLSGLLEPTQLAALFDDIHVQFKAALRASLVQQQVRRDGGPKHGLVSQDLAFYARTMRQLNPGGGAYSDADMKDVWPA